MYRLDIIVNNSTRLEDSEVFLVNQLLKTDIDVVIWIEDGEIPLDGAVINLGKEGVITTTACIYPLSKFLCTSGNAGTRSRISTIGASQLYLLNYNGCTYCGTSAYLQTLAISKRMHGDKLPKPSGVFNDSQIIASDGRLLDLVRVSL